LNDAILEAAYALQPRGKERRKIIFVVSNGVVSTSDKKRYLETKEYPLRNQIIVFCIGQGNSSLFRKVDPLRKYTEPTGGEVLYPWRAGAFAAAYQKVSQSARNRYVLGYTPANLGQETCRKIEVRVTRP